MSYGMEPELPVSGNAGFPGRAVISEWLSRTATHFNHTSWAAGSGPKVCEVNYRSGNIAMAFLYAWPAASYVGLDFGNASRPERLWLERSVVASRAQILPGDAWRTVLAAQQLTACDVVIVGLREHATSSTELQQRLLMDLPNAMRTAAAASASAVGALLLVHGAQCTAGMAAQSRLVVMAARAKTAKGKVCTPCPASSARARHALCVPSAHPPHALHVFHRSGNPCRPRVLPSSSTGACIAAGMKVALILGGDWAPQARPGCPEDSRHIYTRIATQTAQQPQKAPRTPPQKEAPLVPPKVLA